MQWETTNHICQKQDEEKPASRWSGKRGKVRKVETAKLTFAQKKKKKFFQDGNFMHPILEKINKNGIHKWCKKIFPTNIDAPWTEYGYR